MFDYVISRVDPDGLSWSLGSSATLLAASDICGVPMHQTGTAEWCSEELPGGSLYVIADQGAVRRRLASEEPKI